MTKEVAEHLKKMIDAYGGVTASMVLNDAKNKTSPLHGFFQWDDAKAAHEHRLQQARTLIKRYNVTVTKPEDRIYHVPAVILKSGEEKEGVYKPLRAIVKVESEIERAAASIRARNESNIRETEIFVRMLKSSGKNQASKDAVKVLRHLQSAQRTFDTVTI